MKQVLFVLAVVCLQVIQGVITEADLPETDKQCLQELNLPTSLLIENFKEDWTIAEDNTDINKVVVCAFGKHNYLNADNTFDLEKLKDLLLTNILPGANLKFDNPEEVAASSIDSCKTIQGNDAGDTIVKTYNCIINYLKNHA